MKQTFTFKHLFTLSGKDGKALGLPEPALLFDGARAIAASPDAVMWIDCPQPEVDRPILVPVAGIKSALLVSATLKLRLRDGELEANGLKLSAQDPQELIPEDTRALLDFDRKDWESIVRPFSLDGDRFSQLVGGMAENDIRYYLNGAYLDFATGALVTTNGHCMHLVEDALPVVALPARTMQGVIVPASLVKILAKVGGVQEVFVVQSLAKAPPAPPAKPDGAAPEADDPGTITPARLVCFAAANARFRGRAIASEVYPRYRKLFESSSTFPSSAMLGADDVAAVATVAKVAASGAGAVTITGEGRRLTVSCKDILERSFVVGGQLGAEYTTSLNAAYLLNAIRAAGRFGAAMTIRLGRGEGDLVYLGAHDFHAMIAPVKADEKAGEKEGTESDQVAPGVADG